MIVGLLQMILPLNFSHIHPWWLFNVNSCTIINNEPDHYTSMLPMALQPCLLTTSCNAMGLFELYMLKLNIGSGCQAMI